MACFLIAFSSDFFIVIFLDFRIVLSFFGLCLTRDCFIRGIFWQNKNTMMKRTRHINLDDFVCPITRELPTRPVVAADGKVYDESAWSTYVKSNSKGRFKSPWTNRPISKKAYFSISIKEMITQAVRDGHVKDELCTAWKQQFKLEQELEKLKKNAKKDPLLFMSLGDRYYNGIGVASDIETAYMYYQKGWSLTNKDDFFIKMSLANTVRPKRTRTDTICAWSSICQMIDHELAAFVIFKTFEHFQSEPGANIAKLSNISQNNLTVFASSQHYIRPEDVNIANDSAYEIASFLKENSNGHWDSDDSESDESDE